MGFASRTVRGHVALALAFGLPACGARSELWGAPEGDASREIAMDGTVGRRDAGHDSGHDAGSDAGRDAGLDATTQDAAIPPNDAAADAAPDSPPDASDASVTGDATCPPTFAVASAGPSCAPVGTVCTYAEGACTCYGGCRCDSPQCCPRTCLDQGLLCGQVGDGCGNLLECGGCPAHQLCGGGGVPGKCGGNVGPPDACVPRTCADVPGHCGTQSDGCGAQLDCGACAGGWGCALASTGCPTFPPDAGSACAAEGVVCAYTEWLHLCCMQSFICDEGVWSGSPPC